MRFSFFSFVFFNSTISAGVLCKIYPTHYGRVYVSLHVYAEGGFVSWKMRIISQVQMLYFYY